MARLRWGLLFSVGFFLSPVCMSAEQQQQSRGGFSRLYVLQPGPGSAGASGGVRVSSISTRHGAAGQPHTYNVELSANLGGQVRTRRMGNQPASAPQFGQQQSGPAQGQQKQTLKLSGVNVCGGHCCHGWSQAQGSQWCTKPYSEEEAGSRRFSEGKAQREFIPPESLSSQNTTTSCCWETSYVSYSPTSFTGCKFQDGYRGFQTVVH